MNDVTRNAGGMLSTAISLIGEIKTLQQGILQELQRHTILIAYQTLDDGVIRFHHRGEDVRMFIPDAISDQVQHFILSARTFYEVAILDRVLDQFDLGGASVLDVGGNIGNHTVYFMKIAKAAACMTFEPNPYALSILRRNVELNGLQNVTVRGQAVGQAATRMSVDRRDPDNIGATSFRADSKGELESIALDSLEVGAIDFLKVDVEGMALDVVRGGSSFLSQHRPVLFIELFDAERAAVETELGRLGYRLKVDLGDFNYIFER